MSGLSQEEQDSIMAGFEALIAEGKVEVANKKKQKARIQAMTPDQRTAVENKKEYQWHLQNKVKLLIEECSCLNCGEKYQMPIAIYLFYTATTTKRLGGAMVIVDGGNKWKRAEPSDRMPENPERLVDYLYTNKTACQKCWLEKALAEIAAGQPQSESPVISTPAIDLDQLFPKETQSAELVATAA